MASLSLPEYYADAAITTLSSGHTSGSGTISVASTSALSTTRQFHFSIFNQTTGALECVGKATALTGSTYSVTMSLDANASSGDVVVITMGAGAMNQIRADISQQGTFANLPSIASVGDVYHCTDFPLRLRYNGSTWDRYHEVPINAGPLSAWSWVNQTSNSVSASALDGNGVVSIIIPNCTTLNWRLLTQSAASAPWSYVAYLRAPIFIVSSGAALVGIYMSDGTKLMGIELLVLGSGFPWPTYLRVEKITNVTTDDTTVAVLSTGTLGTNSQGAATFLAGIWLRLRNDGTDIYFDWSMTGAPGDWQNLYSEAVGSFLTPTSVGFGGVCAAGVTGFSQASLMSWLFSTSASL